MEQNHSLMRELESQDREVVRLQSQVTDFQRRRRRIVLRLCLLRLYIFLHVQEEDMDMDMKRFRMKKIPVLARSCSFVEMEGQILL